MVRREADLPVVPLWPRRWPGRAEPGYVGFFPDVLKAGQGCRRLQKAAEGGKWKMANPDEDVGAGG